MTAERTNGDVQKFDRMRERLGLVIEARKICIPESSRRFFEDSMINLITQLTQLSGGIQNLRWMVAIEELRLQSPRRTYPLPELSKKLMNIAEPISVSPAVLGHILDDTIALLQNPGFASVGEIRSYKKRVKNLSDPVLPGVVSARATRTTEVMIKRYRLGRK